MNIFRVYLSSTTYHWWNLSSYRWKKKLIELVSKQCKHIRFIDPLKNKSEDPQVCPIDLRDINRSNYVVIFINKLSIGTLLELGYCIFTRRKNFCVLSHQCYVLSHPWIKFLCKDNVYTDIKKVAKLITKKYSKFTHKNFKVKKHGNQKTK